MWEGDCYPVAKDKVEKSQMNPVIVYIIEPFAVL